MPTRSLSDVMSPGTAIPPLQPPLRLATEDEVAKRARAEQAARVEKILNDGGFPLMHRQAHKTGQVAESRLPQCAEWNAKLESIERLLREPGAIVALVGPRGTGKTQMATVAAYDLAARYLEKGFANSCKYARAVEFFMAVKDSYSSSSSEMEAFAPFVVPKLLVIDEVQVRNGTPWEDNAITYLVDSRYSDCKATVLISNQTVDGFRSSMGDSIMSRLSETGRILLCGWASFRGARI